jgi:ribosomal protein L11 methyltransferase
MWISVTLQADANRAERLSDALMNHGAVSVSIEDADAGTDAERPQFGEPGMAPASLWDHSRVIALFEADTDLAAALALAAGEAGFDQVPSFSVEEVADQNWVQLTQSQFDPIRITDRLWIVPSWHQAPVADAINIELDPGMAFGTGSHPTTHLCLEWLEANVAPGCSVMDYGCGSGILAIAAARLGAGRIEAVDIDDKAVEAARDNAERNRVDIHVATSGQPVAGQFERVVANILTNPLCVLAPALCALVAPGGRIALSGILEPQAEQVIEAYAPWIALQVGATREGWVRLEGARP